MKDEKEKYSRNIEISFVISLMFLILLLYFFPRYNLTSLNIIQYEVPAIEVVHIPVTTQPRNNKPRPRKPVIPVELETFEILEYVEIEELMKGEMSELENITGPVSYMDLPFTPRQLLDVLPEKNDESISGLIILSLRIGIDGIVKEHKVIKNTTDCNICLENVIKAVFQSKWEPAIIHDQKVEYWIDKTYQF